MNRLIYGVLALLVLVIGIGAYVHHNRSVVAGLQGELSAEKVKLGQVTGEREAFRAAMEARDKQRALDKLNQLAAETTAAAYFQRSEHEKQGYRDVIARLRTGELQLHPRFGCPAAATAADAALHSGAPAGPAPGGLQVADAEVLVGFAEDADQVTIERNQAVEGWATCRAISDAAPPR